MRYQSTRDKSISFTSAEAIARGLSRDGGLFVPEEIPALTMEEIEKLCGMKYQDRAVYIMKKYLDDFSEEELRGFASAAYADNYDTDSIAPLYKLDEDTFFLELWHGPTCAFKDMALQMLPHLLTASLVKNGEEKQVCILVATSGDTGKAALEGFSDVQGTKIMVFYPKDGVSDIQKLQMASQEGGNVGVCSVVGNFDDAQTGVKAIFSDPELRERLAEKGYFLSSANSINWGRLLPQVVYYVSAYCDVVSSGRIALGDSINICVPTGNFGNILAGYYAKKMGVPVKKLVCASNSNDVLTEFINTGVYNRNRDFYTTISPSMDILVSSNLERLLFEMSGKDEDKIRGYMADLNTKGVYTVDEKIKASLDNEFAAGCCSEEETKETIGETFNEHGYLIDTHTAVAYHVMKAYRDSTGDLTPAVVVSTASPYKFCAAVLEALGEKADADGLTLIDRLIEASGVPAPKPIIALKNKKVRFDGWTEKDGMTKVVEDFLK
ncbi:MAG: threonine synthase [Oscillospiraceae bacterium]|nr:threonine synthase [Oscillospiraceae bacterium]